MKLGHNIFVTGDTVALVCAPADSAIVHVQQETYNQRTVKALSPEVFHFVKTGEDWNHNAHEQRLVNRAAGGAGNAAAPRATGAQQHEMVRKLRN